MSKDALVAAVPNPGGLDDDRYPSLEAYTGYARQIADHLRQLGYRANDPDQTHNWTARKLDEEIEALIDVEDAEGVRFIHILGHGEPKLRSIQPVGADGATDKRCDLELWLRGLQPSAGARPQAPRTLFVLDTCHSGAAADPAWSGDVPAEDLRGWVLAASARDRSAYNARLSKAVAEALGDIRRNEFGVDPSEQWVPWTLFRDRVRNQVERDQDDIHQQRVTASRTDRDVDLPFLANPGFHPPSDIDRARLAAPDGLGEFLDSEHFTTRASGRPGQAAANTIGAFVGRVEELRNVTRWIDERSSGDAVRVITGSPGTGKSALLGILVCAAHPRLRTTTALIWARASTVPQEQSFVAAVHARALTVSQVTASIALQLGLTTQRDPSEGSAVSQTDLISALAAAETPALIVIDALDECANVAALTELIETLASGQRRSGDPLCHLLIGTRSGEGWHAINRWLSALTPQQIINLDETPRHVLNGELEDYFRSALPSAMTSLARRLADKLVEAQTGRSEWGAFLVASLYSQYLQRRSSEGPTDSTAILTAMPTTLPAVVDLDLRADGDPVLPWELLSCLAWTKGSGAPLHLIQRLLSSAFHIDGEVGLSDTIAALDRVRFYLRSTVDELGQTVYRPFHQSIIDQLRTGDIVTATAVLTGLVAERPVINGIRTWESADPYLKTHVLAHALDADRIVELLADAELLVHAEPEAVIVALAAAGDRARETALVYRATSLEDQDPVARRDLLMLNARRANQSALAVRLARPPHGGPLWTPEWATSAQLSRALVNTIRTEAPVKALACALVDGGPLVVAEVAGYGLQRFDLVTGSRIGAAMAGHVSTIEAITTTKIDDRPIAVSGGYDNLVIAWDLTTGERFGEAMHHAFPIRALAGYSLDQRVTAVTAAGDTITAWDVRRSRTIALQKVGRVISITMSREGSETYAFALDSARRLFRWEIEKDRLTAVHLASPEALQLASRIVVTSFAGSSVLVAGNEDGTLSGWDLKSGRNMFAEVKGHSARVTAIEAVDWGTGPAVVTSGADRTLIVWDIGTGSAQTRLTAQTDSPTSLAAWPSEDKAMVVSGGDEGTIRTWMVDPELPPKVDNHPHSDAVITVSATCTVEGPVVVSSGQDRTIRAWKLATGEPLPRLRKMWREPPDPLVCASVNTESTAIFSAQRGVITAMKLADGFSNVNFVSDRELTALAFLEVDGRPIAVYFDSVAVGLWDLSNREKVGRRARMIDVADRVLAAIDVDSHPTAVFGGLDGSVRTWEFGTEKLRTTGPSPDGRAVSAIAVGSVNGRPQALTGSRGGSVCLWDLRDGRLIAHAHSAHGARVSAAALLERDSGPLAVTAGRDRKLRTWDVRSALGRLQELGPPVATPDEVVSLAVPHSNVGGHEALVAGFGKELASYRLEVGRSPDDWSGLSAG